MSQKKEKMLFKVAKYTNILTYSNKTSVMTRAKHGK